MLPAVVAEAGNMTIMMDSGIRRGTDVLKALALGAQFVFIGRPFLYAASIAGDGRRAPRRLPPAGGNQPRHGDARHLLRSPR